MNEGPLHALFRQVVTHPVAVIMVSLAAMVFGYVSYQRLAVELMPDIAYPTITVRTVYEGAAPQEIETQVSRPVEEALATLDGLATLESRSRAGSSDVVLGFVWGTDMSASVQTIRENLQTTYLPAEADRPLILRYDPSLDPFLRVALSFDEEHAGEDDQAALFTLRYIAEQELKRDLEAMEGVAAVRVSGGLEREIRVDVREDWLAARSIRLEQVRDALRSENVNLAGGSILEGDTEFLVRTLNEYQSVEELRELRIRRADGVSIPISDVAVIYETHQERQVVSHLDGIEAVELEVFREADSNVVEVARKVKARLLGEADATEDEQSIVQALPEGVVLEVLDDQAAFIEDAVSNLRNTAILGGLFAIVVLFFFLRDFRSTSIIGLAIPVSVICGFAPLYLREVSLNLMSLGGLALGVGMLVDNAVVVLESIQRYRELEMERTEAAVHGVSAVAAAVTASTLTTVAVFFPITFVEGVAGELFGDLSIAVVSSLLASLVVALFLVPTLAAFQLGDATDGIQGVFSHLAKPRRLAGIIEEVVVAPTEALVEGLQWARERWWRWLFVPYVALRFAGQLLWRQVVVYFAVAAGVIGRFGARILFVVVAPVAAALLWSAARFQASYLRFAARYRSVLAGALRRPALVLVGAAALFGLCVQGLGGLGSELLPEVHQGRFSIEAALPVGTPLSYTVGEMAGVERIARSHPDVQSVYASIGSDRRADAGADQGPHSAQLRIRLEPGGGLAEKEARVMEELRTQLIEAHPRVSFRFDRPALFSVENPVEVVVFGWELSRLREAGEAVAARLRGIDGLVDIRSSLVRGHPEILVRYDRTLLSRFGLDPGVVAQRVRDKVQGIEATRIRRGDEHVSLRVQLVEADRGTLEELRQINVNPSLFPPIPLEAVAKLEEAEGPSEIRRVDQQRAVVVSANLQGFDLGSMAVDIEEALAGAELPPDMAWSVEGQSKEMQKSLGSLQFALLLAVFLVYVIMASAFENLLHPFVILFSVPLALVGVVVALATMGLSLSVVVFIGMIVLAGVVVNNAIVLVDTINRLRVEGRERLAAIAEASHLRLRPILITTATTVLGLFPLALGLGAGAEVQQPLAVAVIGGLLSSTLLTLVVIPVGYELVTRPRQATEPEPITAPGVAQ